MSERGKGNPLCGGRGADANERVDRAGNTVRSTMTLDELLGVATIHGLRDLNRGRIAELVKGSDLRELGQLYDLLGDVFPEERRPPEVEIKQEKEVVKRSRCDRVEYFCVYLSVFSLIVLQGIIVGTIYLVSLAGDDIFEAGQRFKVLVYILIAVELVLLIPSFLLLVHSMRTHCRKRMKFSFWAVMGSFVAINMTFAGIYMLTWVVNEYAFVGLEHKDRDVSHAYLIFLYYSLITFATIGYGDVHPSVDYVCPLLWVVLHTIVTLVFIVFLFGKAAELFMTREPFRIRLPLPRLGVRSRTRRLRRGEVSAARKERKVAESLFSTLQRRATERAEGPRPTVRSLFELGTTWPEDLGRVDELERMEAGSRSPSSGGSSW